MTECPTCGGSGVVDTTPDGVRAPWLQSDTTCPSCHGSGEKETDRP